MPNVPILPCAKSYFTDFIVLKVKIWILQSVETQNLAPQDPHGARSSRWRLCWARNYLKILSYSHSSGKTSGPSHDINMFFKPLRVDWAFCVETQHMLQQKKDPCIAVQKITEDCTPDITVFDKNETTKFTGKWYSLSLYSLQYILWSFLSLEAPEQNI